MKKRYFSQTGFTVSELCFGTMNFGWTIDRQTAFTLLDTYRAAGGTFLQSVHVCGDVALLPDSFKAPEVWIGEWMRERAIPREELVLSTRVTLLDNNPNKNEPLSTELMRCCETLLERMGISSLDLLVVEWNRRFLPASDAARAFDTVKKSGLVRHLSIANAPNWRIMESIANSDPDSGIDGIQSSLSIHTRRDTGAETLDLCDSYSLGLTVTSALGGGQVRVRSAGSEPSNTEGNAHLLRLLSAVAAKRKGTIQQVALAWTLSHQAVSSVITSVSSSEQLKELIDATSWDLSSVGALQTLTFKNSDSKVFSRAPRLTRFPNSKITL